ncbi:MAG: non-homologous end-joining DNA ligase, partial [Methanothrix sp.]
MPDFLHPIKPMLAVSGQPFDSPDWIFEPKIDGTRAIATVSSGTVRLRNRRLVDIIYRYPELEEA